MSEKKVKESDKLNIRGKAFYDFLDNYIKTDEYKKVKEMWRNRVFTVKETKVEYRVINHWGTQGILPSAVKSDGKWRKFSFPEVVWLRIVNVFRDWGVSLERLRDANKSIMKCESGDSYPIFELYLMYAWRSEEDPYIIMWLDGHTEVLNSDEIEKAKILYGSQHFIAISLKQILKDIGLKSMKESKILYLLEDEEVDLISEIRFGNNQEIDVSVRGGKVTGLKAKNKIIGSTIDRMRLFEEARKEQIYGSITIKFENGVEQFAEVIKSSRVKK